MAWVLGAHGLLAGELAEAVGGEWIRSVELVVGAPRATVEHVVGRDVHQSQVPLGCRERQVAGAHRIPREGPFRVALGAVHGVVGRGVDHQVGPHALHGGAHRGEIGDVELGVRARHDLVATEAPRDGLAQLSAGAGEQHPHASKSS